MYPVNAYQKALWAYPRRLIQRLCYGLAAFLLRQPWGQITIASAGVEGRKKHNGTGDRLLHVRRNLTSCHHAEQAVVMHPLNLGKKIVRDSYHHIGNLRAELYGAFNQR